MHGHLPDIFPGFDAEERVEYGYLTHLSRLRSEQCVGAQAAKERYPTAFNLVIRYSRPTTNWVVPLYSPDMLSFRLGTLRRVCVQGPQQCRLMRLRFSEFFIFNGHEVGTG